MDISRFTEYRDKILDNCSKVIVSRQHKQVLLCVVNRFEAMRLRRIVFEADPRAFVVANKAKEVLGEGFKSA